MRRITGRALFLGLLVFTLASASAHAATANRIGNTISFTAAAGEANRLQVSFEAAAVEVLGQPAIVFNDVVPVTAMATCAARGSDAVCPRTGATSVSIALGDLDDQLQPNANYPADLPVSATGDAGPDDLLGSPAADTYSGGADADSLNGGANTDTLDGGPAGDELIGGAGVDTVTYENVPDPIYVALDGVDNDGTKCAPGGAGPCENDKVGGNLNDVERVIGGTANDTIIDQGLLGLNPTTANTFEGRDGDDTLIGQGGGDTLIGEAGNDTLMGGDLGDTLNGGDDNDTVQGQNGNDTMTGDAGDDTLQGGTGTDGMDGGGGTDTATYAERVAGENVTVNLQTDTGGVAAENDTLPAIENATGGGGADTLTGSDGEGNVLSGLGGDDNLRGEAGATAASVGDVFNGGAGTSDEVFYDGRTADLTLTLDGQPNDGTGTENDDIETDVEEVTAGAGDDVVTGSASNGRLTGGAGDDVLDGGLGADVLQGGTHGGATTRNGDSGDFVTYASRPAGPVTVTLAGAADDGAPSEGDDVQTVENVTGSGGDDLLVGDANANQLNGGPGDADVLVGNGAADVLDGGAGANDEANYAPETRAAGVTVTLNDTADDGGVGENDNVKTENVRGTTFTDVMTGSGGANELRGVNGGDVLNGSSGEDELFGGDGIDSLDGGTANDIIDGGPQRDLMDGGTGSDTVTYAGRTSGVDVELGTANGNGEAGEDDDVGPDIENVIGGSAADTLTGADDRVNRLDGGPGDDFLDGGDTVVPDTLIGGTGSDTALYVTRTAPVTITLNDTADDGEVNEKDEVDGTVENVTTGSGNDTVTGDTNVNVVDVAQGNDTVNVRDSVADTVICDGGTDTATLDSLDNASACETVDRSAAPNNTDNQNTGNQNTNQNTGTTTTDTTPTPTPIPPINTPTPPNNQPPPSGLPNGPRQLPRSISAAVGPRRDRRAPYRFLISGQVGLPAAFAPFRAQVCGAGGTVSVQTKVGSRTVSTRRVRLDRDCQYDITVVFSSKRRLMRNRNSARLKFTARFLGNRYLQPRAARAVFGRAG
jgi:Ca2+-binding RTX toxin-like protein